MFLRFSAERHGHYFSQVCLGSELNASAIRVSERVYRWCLSKNVVVDCLLVFSTYLRFESAWSSQRFGKPIVQLSVGVAIMALLWFFTFRSLEHFAPLLWFFPNSFLNFYHFHWWLSDLVKKSLVRCFNILCSSVYTLFACLVQIFKNSIMAQEQLVAEILGKCWHYCDESQCFLLTSCSEWVIVCQTVYPGPIIRLLCRGGCTESQHLYL